MSEGRDRNGRGVRGGTRTGGERGEGQEREGSEGRDRNGRGARGGTGMGGERGEGQEWEGSEGRDRNGGREETDQLLLNIVCIQQQ